MARRRPFAPVLHQTTERERAELAQLRASMLEPHEGGLEELRESIKKQEDALYKAEQDVLDQILPEAFACVREASRRTIGLRHYDVQVLGGIVLHRGRIAEMKTGEGKTLVATLPIYLNAISGRGVHLVTVNDYLARRDVQWMGPIYHMLGLTCSAIVHDESFLFDPSYRGQGLPHAQPAAGRAQGRLPGRHHLRHQPRVRVRLPARQHEVLARRVRAARAGVFASSTRSTTSSSTRRARR